MANAQISEICRRCKVSDYLAARGVELIRSGGRTRCCCPIHSERTPSFFIKVLSDGTELFKCFGCGGAGNIISLIRMMEGGTRNGAIVMRLSKTIGMELGSFDESIQVDPMSSDVMAAMSGEDDISIDIGMYAKEFLAANNFSDDAVAKISGVYMRMDDMIDRGDENALTSALGAMMKIVSTYEI